VCLACLSSWSWPRPSRTWRPILLNSITSGIGGALQVSALDTRRRSWPLHPANNLHFSIFSSSEISSDAKNRSARQDHKSAKDREHRAPLAATHACFLSLRSGHAFLSACPSHLSRLGSDAPPLPQRGGSFHPRQTLSPR